MTSKSSNESSQQLEQDVNNQDHPGNDHDDDHDPQVQQQQQQQQQQSSLPDDGKQNDDLERSVLHDLLKESDWKALLAYLGELRNKESDVIEHELSKLDEHNATPLHTAVWKAPMPLVKLILSVIPFDFRELILLKQDMDGNTPLHLACANLELKKTDGSLDVSVIKTLAVGAPHAHEMVNWQGDTPLHLLVTSPAFRADPSNFEAETVAQDLVNEVLQTRVHLASVQNRTGATMLHAAAAHGAYERVLMALLEVAPACAEIADKVGMLPLHYVAACVSGKGTPAALAFTLVEAYPDAVVHPCNTGDTPLHLFVCNAKRNIDKHERNSRNTAKLVEVLLGSSKHESMCPLLVINKESVSWSF